MDRRIPGAVCQAPESGCSLTEVIGLVLVRNEERFIRRVLTNIVGFCDRVIVADNRSADSTWTQLVKCRQSFDNIELYKIDSPAESHDLVAGYAGTNTWIFGVDGDEIYDPAGLLSLRKRIENGEYDQYWQVFGNVLNCIELDEARKVAMGYLSPPSRSMTKLFNFSAITSWRGCTTERLHGGEIRFRRGVDASFRYMLNESTPWEVSTFRCLHVCFLPRSSVDERRGARRNIVELQSRSRWHRLKEVMTPESWRIAESRYKAEKYRRGKLQEMDVEEFFPSIRG